MTKLLVKGGRVIDPANGIDEVIDLLVTDGIIAAVDKNIKAAAEVIDAAGLIVCPGLVDIHTHLREPGYEYKEDIASGTRAAAAGGFTTICCMPNTKPVIDNGATASFVRERARKSGVVNVYPVGAITQQQEGKRLAPIAELIAAGCVAVSDDGQAVMSSEVMKNALEYAKMWGLPVLSHCEDKNLSHNGQMNEGYYSILYGLKGIPAVAEDIMVSRDILLAELTGAHVHICHVSTRGAVELIRRAKKKGIHVTCEVAPHHLTLTDEIVGTYDTDTKVNPPLRTGNDIEALIAALSDGTIDCIATDHAPHNIESKDCEYNLAAYGISGLETAVAVCMDWLFHTGKVNINQLIKLLTIQPAEVLRLNRGTLDIGAEADITIINPETKKQVVPNRFYSKGTNTPYKGMMLKGWPYMTIVKGRIVARDGIIL